MFQKEKMLLAAASGTVIPLSDVPDPVFSEKMLGDGYCVIPKSGEVFSPAEGVIIDISEQGHAYSIMTKDNTELLVHIGIDTVSLEGKGFSPLASKGETVLAGEKIADVDLDLIKKHGLYTHIPVVITNFDELKSFRVAYGQAEGGKTAALFYKK